MVMKRSAVLIMLLGVSLLGSERVAWASGADEIIARVNQQYESMESIRGRFRRESRVGIQRESVVGDFVIKKPGRVYVHNLEPRDSYLISNGSVVWLYDKEAQEVIEVPITPLEGFPPALVEATTMFNFNPFPDMENGYSCRRIDDYEQHRIVACQPIGDGSGAISRVLVKVDPLRWLVVAVELFDPDGALFSQTRYENIVEAGDAQWFPLRSETRLIADGQQVVEVVEYTRVRINDIPEDAFFEFQVPEGTRRIGGIEGIDGWGPK